MSADSSQVPPAAGLDSGRLRTSLILILVGGPLVVVDLTISTGGPGVDILHDTIGWILITIALATLANVSGPPTHRSRTGLLLVLAVLALLGSILVQLGVQASPLISALLGVLGVAGAVLFCITMRELVGFHGMALSESSWRTSTTIVAAIWGGAAAIALVVTIAAEATGVDTYFDVSGDAVILLALLVLAILLLPMIFIIISIAKTLRDVRTGPLSP